MEREEFATLIFEFSESCQSIPPRRNSNRVQSAGNHEICHGKIVQGSIRIHVDRVLVPDLSGSPKNRVRQYVREKLF